MERGRKVGDRHFPLFIMSNPLRRLISPPRKLVSKYLTKGMVAADLGCGPGYFTLPMTEIVGEEGKVYALDSDMKSIRALASKAAKRKYGNIEARVGSASDLGFIPAGSVDFVLAKGLLCCMSDHAGAVKEIRRILKPNGLVYLDVSKLSRKKDPRSVRREEWQKILAGFQVLGQGEGLTTLWASCRNPHM